MKLLIVMLCLTVAANVVYANDKCQKEAMRSEFLDSCKSDFLNEYATEAQNKFRKKIDSECLCFSTKLELKGQTYDYDTFFGWPGVQNCKFKKGAVRAVIRIINDSEQFKECNFSWHF